MDFGSCQCYEDGSIGCVGIPLTAAPRTLILFLFGSGDSKVDLDWFDWSCGIQFRLLLWYLAAFL